MHWGQSPPFPASAVVIAAVVLAILCGSAARSTRPAFWLGTAFFAVAVWYSRIPEGLFKLLGVSYALAGGLLAVMSHSLVGKFKTDRTKQP